MAKLSFTAAPTFKAKVGIPVAGGATVDAELIFKHRTKTKLDEFVAARINKTDTETFMDMVVGWDFEEEFNQESVELLLENYIGTGVAAYRVYMSELIKAKEKN